MDTRELLKVDLNLLISLQVLLDERSVSRAAERLFITQPAMSKTLSRLRSLFDDALFTRSSHGMLPTPRALQMAPDLSRLLEDVKHLVSGPSFDPATCDTEITLALSEYIGVGVLPQLLARLQRLAPRLTLKTITRVENQLEQLASGDLDIAIHIKHASYSEDYLVEEIGTNPPVILARQGHPLAGKTPSWEDLERYPLIRLYIADLDQLEVMRQSKNFLRIRNRQQGTFETSHLLTALEVLRHTDYLMPGPPHVLSNPRVSEDITALPFPEGPAYAVSYKLVTHRRTANSPLHNWLRQQIMLVVRELTAKARAANTLN